MRWFFAALGQYGTRVLFVSVFAGLLLPDLASLLRPLLPPGVAAILALGLVRIEWASMVSYARRPILVGLVVAWLMVAAPVAVWVVFKLFALPDALETAVVLMACAPPILGSIAIALLLGLDAPLAIVCGLVSTLLTPITVPPLALELLGLALDVSTLEFMLRLATLVLSSFLAAVLIRRWLGKERLASWGTEINGSIVLVMALLAIAIMDGVSATIGERPDTVLLWLVAAYGVNLLLQAVGTACFLHLGLRRALTIGLMSGNCNMMLILATLPPDTDFDVVLFFALAQFPMYTLPALVHPVYRRLLAREKRESS